MKLIVDWWLNFWLVAVTAAVLRINWYYYNKTKMNRHEWNSFKLIKFYIDETKKDYGHIGLSFWILVAIPFAAFVTLVLRVFYYKHL